MVAIAYTSLGGISGATELDRAPYSKRGRDADRFQTFMFFCSEDRPFSGIVHLQGSVDEPPQAQAIKNKANVQEDLNWVDVVEIEFTNEGGSFFVQTELELAHFRVVCRPGNYWSAVGGTPGAVVSTDGSEFTINGLGPITVLASDDAQDVADAINANGAIIGDGTIQADTIGRDLNELRIYTTDGSDLVLADTAFTPLADMGIAPGTYESGEITAIKSMR